MPWGSMTSDQRIRVILDIIGGPTYRKHMEAAAKSTKDLAAANLLAQKSATKAARATFLYNQMLFTMRRYSFYATLGITAMIAEVVRLGFQYNATMQSARAMLRTIIPPQELTSTLNRLFVMAAETPFQFKDTVQAFQLMYAGFRPLGISINETLRTIEALTNGLAFAGKSTPANLQRVSIALQHMAFAGRLTGYTVNQLWRDGIPMFAILNKTLGLTAEQLHNVGSLGIPTATVLKAIQDYLLNTEGYKGAALRSQLETLSGAFSTFKDILSQASGSSTSGLFGGLTKFFQQVDLALIPYTHQNKPISLMQFVQAIDQAASPKSHLVLNMFKFFTAAFNGLKFAISSTLWVFQKFIDMLAWLGGKVGLGDGKAGTGMAATILGWTAGILFFAVASRRAIVGIRALGKAIRTELAIEAGSVLLSRTSAGIRGAFATEAMLGPTGAWMGTKFKNNTRIARSIRAISGAMRGLAAATLATSKAFAIFLVTNPFGWAIILATLLIILYFRWKRFHNFVNFAYKNMIYWAPLVAAALTLAFGPIYAAITALLLVIRYWKEIKGFTQAPTPPTNQGKQSFFHKRPRSQQSGFEKTFGLNPGIFKPPDWLPGKGGILSWFQHGGNVPGPLGSPRLIVAHGGEHVTRQGENPPAQQPHATHINIILDRKSLARAIAYGDADIIARA